MLAGQKRVAHAWERYHDEDAAERSNDTEQRTGFIQPSRRSTRQRPTDHEDWHAKPPSGLVSHVVSRKYNDRDKHNIDPVPPLREGDETVPPQVAGS